MFITNTFVYVHQPKTGGTFVSAILERIHEARGDRVETIFVEPGRPAPPLPVVRSGVALKLMLGERYQHGRRSDIPSQYRDRQVVATIRNPYDRYVSQFEFAWWRKLPGMFGPVEDVQRTYPRFPDLTFAEFVQLTNTVSIPYRRDGDPEQTPGFHTQQFIEYFCQEPAESVLSLRDDDLALETLAADLQTARFLDQENLNSEFHAFLLTAGYSPEEIAFVAEADRIFPPEGGRGPDAQWAAYYSPALKALVRRKERLLFRLFPKFDV